MSPAVSISDRDAVSAFRAHVRRQQPLTDVEEERLGRRIEAGRRAREMLEEQQQTPPPATWAETSTAAVADLVAVAQLSRLELRRIGRLSQAEALAALEHYGTQARDRLIVGSLGLAANNARRYEWFGIQEAIQWGSFGLIRAAEKWDWQRGYRFSTYATYWIRQSIDYGIDGEGSLIRLPVNICKDMRCLRRARQTFAQTRRRQPTLEELSRAEPSLTQSKVQWLDRAAGMNVMLYLDRTIGRRSVIADLIADGLGEDPFGDIETRVDVSRLLVRLGEEDPQARKIIELRYGFTGAGAMTFHDIGKSLGLNKARTRRIHDTSLNRLRELWFGQSVYVERLAAESADLRMKAIEFGVPVMRATGGERSRARRRRGFPEFGNLQPRMMDRCG